MGEALNAPAMRDRWWGAQWQPRPLEAVILHDLDEALAEVERLRREVEVVMDAANNEVPYLRAEVERLRAAIDGRTLHCADCERLSAVLERISDRDAKLATELRASGRSAGDEFSMIARRALDGEA